MQRFAVILFWGAAAFALIMASLPHAPELKVASGDKILHMIAFAVLALLGTFAYPALRLSVLLLGLSAFGMLIELSQLIPALSRTADWRDPAADILTTAAVVGAIYIFCCLRKLSQLTSFS